MRIIFVDGSTKLETIYDLEHLPRGGMVNSLFKVTNYLAWRGHDVTVLSDIKCTGVTKHGVKWDHEHWGEYDCLITNRGTGAGYADIQAKSRILWTHDLPHSGFIPEPKTIRAYDATVFMSEYAERVWRTFYKDIGYSAQIPNGVTTDLFRPRAKEGYLVYASAPNRGLDKLPLIHDALQTRLGREVPLRAYSNLAKLHPGETGAGDTFDYKKIEDSSVQLMDPVRTTEFASVLGRSMGLVLPSGYPEICSNVVLQALASGTPVFATGGFDSTSEWVVHRCNGMLTRFGPWDYMVHIIEMVRNLVEYCDDEKMQKRLQHNAVRSGVLNWKQIGRGWEKLIKKVA